MMILKWIISWLGGLGSATWELYAAPFRTEWTEDALGPPETPPTSPENDARRYQGPECPHIYAKAYAAARAVGLPPEVALACARQEVAVKRYLRDLGNGGVYWVSETTHAKRPMDRAALLGPDLAAREAADDLAIEFLVWDTFKGRAR